VNIAISFADNIVKAVKYFSFYLQFSTNFYCFGNYL